MVNRNQAGDHEQLEAAQRYFRMVMQVAYERVLSYVDFLPNRRDLVGEARGPGGPDERGAGRERAVSQFQLMPDPHVPAPTGPLAGLVTGHVGVRTALVWVGALMLVLTLAPFVVPAFRQMNRPQITEG